MQKGNTMLHRLLFAHIHLYIVSKFLAWNILNFKGCILLNLPTFPKSHFKSKQQHLVSSVLLHTSHRKFPKLTVKGSMKKGGPTTLTDLLVNDESPGIMRYWSISLLARLPPTLRETEVELRFITKMVTVPAVYRL